MSHSTRRIVHVVAVALIALIASTSERIVHGQSAAAPGGLVESATGVGLRATLTAGEIGAFLPSRGRFTFPSPYRTTGVRLTNATDCGGADCVLPVGYSYWSNINNHAGSETMLIFLGLNRQKGGGGPTLFSFNKRTGETRQPRAAVLGRQPVQLEHRRGLVLQRHASERALPERRSAHAALRRASPIRSTTVFDAARQLGADKYLWQMHSSDDDRVHSATLRQASYLRDARLRRLQRGDGRVTFFAKKGDFDECQIDRSGRWLVIKENVDGRQRRGQSRHRSADGHRTAPHRPQRRRRPLRPRLRLS